METLNKMKKNLVKYVREALLILSLVLVSAACECTEDFLTCEDVECTPPEFDECNSDGNLRSYTGQAMCIDDGTDHVYCEFEYDVIECDLGCTVFEGSHDHCNLEFK